MCKMHYGFALTTGRQPSVFSNCLACGALIDLRVGRKPGTVLINKPRLCSDCLRRRPRARWCMTPKQLAERDGATCSICTQPVDLSLRWPEPLSASVDHRIPRSRGGLDVPLNVALAHLACNVSKGIRAPA
ncbi:HNH endonuclease [Streptomyces youssoufiensis]